MKCPLPVGKLPPDLLRQILAKTPIQDPRVILGPGIGLDCAVLNVGSTAGIRPIPHLSVYAATKAYVDHFSRALAWELRNTGVGISLLLPSTTATEFFDRGEIPLQRPSGFVDSAATVATAGVSAVERQRVVATPGWKVGLLARALRWLPSSIVNRSSDSVFKEEN